jgi:hypothetical protein
MAEPLYLFRHITGNGSDSAPLCSRTGSATQQYGGRIQATPLGLVVINAARTGHTAEHTYMSQSAFLMVQTVESGATMVYNPGRHTQVITSKLRVVRKSYKSIMRNITKTLCETCGYHGPLYS